MKMSPTILYPGEKARKIRGQAAIMQVGLMGSGNKIMRLLFGNRIMTPLTNTSPMLCDSLVLCNFKFDKLI